MKNKFMELEQVYYNVHQVGYRRMPKEMYLNWLFRVNKDSTRKPYVFQTPQPFKKHNYKVLVMTAGNGENYEFFDQEETTRIGTVEINRRTKKIVKFIEPEEDDMPDEVIGRMYDPTVGRFWQVDPMAQERDWLSPYNFVQNNPINRVDPTGALDWVANADGEIYWDKNANSQETTKQGETYLGKDLTFTFNSYINSTFDGAQPPWEVTGDKLTSTISLTSNEDSDGNLQSVDVTSSYSIGETGGLSIFKGRDFFPGLGDNQNQSINLNDVKSFSATFEQHASVPGLEAAGLNMLGYDIVNVAQKMTLGLSGNKLSVSAATDIFPSATLSVNGTQLFQYNQPSFRATHGRDTRFSDNGVGGVAGESVPRRPAPSFYQRYKK
jgi:RHS repeat-associated protein